MKEINILEIPIEYMEQFEKLFEENHKKILISINREAQVYYLEEEDNFKECLMPYFDVHIVCKYEFYISKIQFKNNQYNIEIKG